MDYGTYRFSRKEWMINIGGYCALDGVISILFYRSWIAFVVLLPGVILFSKNRKKICAAKRITALERQFLAGMQAVSNALGAGYSIENAFLEALTELEKVYGREESIIAEFKTITKLLSLNRSIEEVLTDFGRRSHSEDIENFAEVFSAARRSGGDLMAIIRNTVSSISQKAETLEEIQVCIAAKRLEQNVMSVVPIAILCYVGTTSPGFLDGMYHNMTGVTVMSGCLITYFAAWYLGRKIVNIEV